MGQRRGICAAPPSRLLLDLAEDFHELLGVRVGFGPFAGLGFGQWHNAGGAAGAALNALRVNGPCAAGATQEKFAGLFAIQDFLDIVKTSGLTMVVPDARAFAVWVL